jgi:hypothetical protein
MRGFVLIATLLAATAMAPAHAQTICPDGKTFSGACVKPELGEAMRKQVFVATQPKISYTAPPVLPSEDGTYATLRDYNELKMIYGIGAPAAVGTPGAPACVPSRGNPC